MKRLSFLKNPERFLYKLNISDKMDLDFPFSDHFQGAFIRAEYAIRDSGHHITQKPAWKNLKSLIEETLEVFPRKEVYYRMSDFTINEANRLNGAQEAPIDYNELCGLRGVRRALKEPESLQAELSLVTTLREKWDNLHILIPMVHDEEQLRQVYEELDNVGYSGKRAVMMEIPSAFITSPYFPPVDNFVIGINDLSSFILGSHRQLEDVYSRTHRAVYSFLSRNIEGEKRYSIAGYLGTSEIEMAKNLGLKEVYLRPQELPSIFEEFKGMNINARAYVKNNENSPSVASLY